MVSLVKLKLWAIRINTIPKPIILRGLKLRRQNLTTMKRERTRYCLWESMRSNRFKETHLGKIKEERLFWHKLQNKYNIQQMKFLLIKELQNLILKTARSKWYIQNNKRILSNKAIIAKLLKIARLITSSQQEEWNLVTF